MVYLHNNTGQTLKCHGFSGSDWRRVNEGVILPGQQGFATAAMDCPGGLDSNWGSYVVNLVHILQTRSDIPRYPVHRARLWQRPAILSDLFPVAQQG